jgi:hypothetical protein
VRWRHKIISMCTNGPRLRTLKLGRNQSYEEIWVGDVDLLAMEAEIRTLRLTVKALVEDVTELQEQVVAMWMAPGMPGAVAAKKHFEALAWVMPHQ